MVLSPAHKGYINKIKNKLNDMNNLIIPTLRIFPLCGIASGVLLFLPAGMLNYWQAWVFIAVFMVRVSDYGVYFSINDPEFLERRKKVGPAAKQMTSKNYRICSDIRISQSAGFLYIRSSLRMVTSPAICIIGGKRAGRTWNLHYFLTSKENSYAATTIQIEEGQKVISTGLYALVRHPMYVGGLVMVTGIPLALGSWRGLAIFVLIIPVLIWRILDEEKLLEKDLPGYTEYETKVRYRLVPYLW